MQQAWVLALMNARFYQYNLEQVYLAALPVTLQRFTFEPQFYGEIGSGDGRSAERQGSAAAGFPSTPGVAAGTGLGYTYATRFARTARSPA